jgi:hypothetical protein
MYIHILTVINNILTALTYYYYYLEFTVAKKQNLEMSLSRFTQIVKFVGQIEKLRLIG